MKTLLQKTELAANLAIIVVAILLVTVLVRVYLFPRSPAPPTAASSIAPGTKLSLAGIDWRANGKTLVLALSTGCRFCTESAPFYQRLAQERAQARKVRIVAVFPEPVSEGLKYLSDLRVPVDEVRQASLSSIGVTGTPTVIIADDDGKVANSWRGKLPPEKEAETLSLLK